MSNPARLFVDHIELWLSAAGLLVVGLVAVVVGPEGGDVWRTAAVTALLISVLHGLIFYVVRRRQRAVRQRAILEIREMMADLVKNDLAVIGMWAQTGERGTAYERRVASTHQALREIGEKVDGLSEESLRSWRLRYRGGGEEPAAERVGSAKAASASL